MSEALSRAAIAIMNHCPHGGQNAIGYPDEAECVLKAMKDPDPAMIRAGMCVLEEVRGANHVRRADMELVEAIWRAMVEEALR